MVSPEKTDRLGLSWLESFFSSQGWLFRECFAHDLGIDAQVEIVDNNKPTGRLIVIQTAELIVTANGYRAHGNHLQSWVKNCLPGIVVLYDPEDDVLYWESVSENTLIRTGNDWGVDIPKTKVLNHESLVELGKLADLAPAIRKLHRLRLDKPWIDLLANGEVVYLEFDDFVNKTSSRLAVKIGCETKKGVAEATWPIVYGKELSLNEAISSLLPWAEFEVDEKAYYEFMETQWHKECYLGCDDSGEEYYLISFEQWCPPPEGLRPVSEGDEVNGYRLILSLNQVGKAFCGLDDFLFEGEGA